MEQPDEELGVIRVMRVADIADVLPDLRDWTCCRCGAPGSRETFGGFVMSGRVPIVFCSRSDCVNSLTGSDQTEGAASLAAT